MDAFWVWLASKGQVDFGNALVGIGGVLLAWATVRATRSANNAAAQNLLWQSRSKIAEFRMQWISEFRSQISEIVELQYKVALLKNDRVKKARGGEDVSELNRQLRDLYPLISRCRYQIIMMLKQNSESEDEIKLEAALRSAVKDEGTAAGKQRSEIRELARAILKQEWERVKRETEHKFI